MKVSYYAREASKSATYIYKYHIQSTQCTTVFVFVLFVAEEILYIPNGCKHFKILFIFFYGNEANSNKPLKNEKISGIERLVLPFPDT